MVAKDVLDDIVENLGYIFSSPKTVALTGLMFVGTAAMIAKDKTQHGQKDPTRIMPYELNSVLTNGYALQPAAITMTTTTPYTDGNEVVTTFREYPIKSPGKSLEQHLEYKPISVNKFFKSWHKRIDATDTTILDKAAKKQYHKNLIELAGTLEKYVSPDALLWSKFIQDGVITRGEFDALKPGLYAIEISSKDQYGKDHASVISLVYRGPGYTPEEKTASIPEKNIESIPERKENPKIEEPNKKAGYIGAGVEVRKGYSGGIFQLRGGIPIRSDLLLGLTAGFGEPERSDSKDYPNDFNGGSTINHRYDNMIAQIGPELGFDIIKGLGVFLGAQYNIVDMTKNTEVKQLTTEGVTIRPKNTLLPQKKTRELYWTFNPTIDLGSEGWGVYAGAKVAPGHIPAWQLGLRYLW